MIKDLDGYEQLMKRTDLNEAEKLEKVDYSTVLDATGYFGIRDLLIAEPSPYDVRTLSHVHLYAVDLAHLEEVFGEDELLKLIMDDEKVSPPLDSELGSQIKKV
jgi:CRP-like cAMP-binding protein